MRPSLHRRPSDCADVLRDYLARGQTGRLQRPHRASRGPGGLHVFVMAGEILAAHGPDDGIWIVRRLVNGGALTERLGRAFTRALERGQPFEELLVSKIPGRVLSAMMEGRFRQNLLDFVTGTSAVRFEPMDTIFVANLQHGHDSLALLRAITNRRDRIAPLAARRSPLTLRPGPSMPATQVEARLLDFCDPASSLQRLLTFSPYEPGDTLDAVVSMLGAGTLVSDEGVRLQADPLARRSHLPGPGSRPDPRFAVEDLFDAGPPLPPPGIPAPQVPPAWAQALFATSTSSSLHDFGELPDHLAQRWAGAEVVVELGPPPREPEPELAHSLEPGELEDLRSLHSLLPDDLEPVEAPVEQAVAPPPRTTDAELTAADIFSPVEELSARLDAPVEALEALSPDSLQPIDSLHEVDEAPTTEPALLGAAHAYDDLSSLQLDFTSLHDAPSPHDAPDAELDTAAAAVPAEAVPLDEDLDPDLEEVESALHIMDFGGSPADLPPTRPPAPSLADDETEDVSDYAGLFDIDAGEGEGGTELVFEDADSLMPGADNGAALVEAARRYLLEAQEARAERGREAAGDAAEVLQALEEAGPSLADDSEEVSLIDNEEIVVKPPGFVFDEVELDESELAAFADNDITRGDRGQGQFTLERRLLDVVDLSEETLRSLARGSEPDPVPVAEEEPVFLEMGEASEEDELEAGAVALSFSAPVVSNSQAVGRVEVALDVLSRLALQLDRNTGLGTGQTTVQLLLESAPNQFGALLHSLQADRSGRFPPMDLVARLNERPQHERRFLLDRCLNDLIERALGSALEELPEPAVDQLLEEIAGYQQRLRA